MHFRVLVDEARIECKLVMNKLHLTVSHFFFDRVRIIPPHRIDRILELTLTCGVAY